MGSQAALRKGGHTLYLHSGCHNAQRRAKHNVDTLFFEPEERYVGTEMRP
jgi:hypothetical protein